MCSRNLYITLVLLSAWFTLNAQESQPTGPDPHQNYQYPYTIEELQEYYSTPMVSSAQLAVAEMERVNLEGQYRPEPESLAKHPAPEWYRDAKLGIFFDWGLYSVAGYGEKGWSRARYPDWYLYHMYANLKDYHEAYWGREFHRDDFIPLFDASGFHADSVIKLVKASGARYFVPFSKHHDGFCLWDSKFTHRDVVDLSPGRDLSAELIESCKQHGLYHGFYFSVEEYEYPLIKGDGSLCVRLWSDGMAPDNAGLTSMQREVREEFVPELHNRMLSGKVPVHHFINEYTLPQAKDYIDRYDPDILWFDGEWQRPVFYYRTPELVAYFYNRAEGRKEVVVNDRWGKGTRGKLGDFNTSETDEVVEAMEEPWEENRSMSESYGYNWADSLSNYLTQEELIHMLVRIVAKGGNLNLIVNPDGQGHIPEIQGDLLRELGAWLGINGEAIYGTRPYEAVSDNTQLGQPVWYTMSKDGKYGYAIVLQWPKSHTFICNEANIKWETIVYMLGHDTPLEWVDTGREHWGMSAKVPEEMLRDPSRRPCKYAWVLRFEYDRENEYGD